jgi:hypothetical protein
MDDLKWCVMVLATGDIFYKDNSKRILIDYFIRHSIPYHFIEEVPQGIDFKLSHPSWWKLLCHKILPGYDFILCWDLDLLPRKSTVDIISKISMTELCLAKDSHVIHHNDEKFIFSEKDKYRYSFQYNGGLIGIPKDFSVFTESVFQRFAPGDLPSYEQYYLNEMICQLEIPVFELPTSLNRLYWDPDFATADLQHYTGTEDAKSYISQHANIYFSDT